eukprot:m.119305 g.119305  ORF g.119305 m.119305 type:complete len:478 (+) comp9354_c0_seq23:234-1667(+)
MDERIGDMDVREDGDDSFVANDDESSDYEDVGQPTSAIVAQASRLFREMNHRELVDSLNSLLSFLKQDFVKALPSEICGKVFSYLPMQDVKTCELVCRSWQYVIYDNNVWKEICFNRFQTVSSWKQMFHSSASIHPMVPIEWKIYCRVIAEGLRYVHSCWLTGTYEPTVIESESDGIYCLQFDEDKIISGDRQNEIKIWGLDDCKLRRAIKGHTGSVLCLQYDDDMIVTSSSDATIRLWDIHDNYTCKNVIRYHQDSVLHVRFDNERLVSCSKDKSIVVWKKEKPFHYTALHHLDGHQAAVNVVEFDKRNIVSASGDRTLKIWDPQNGELRLTLRGHTRGIACIHYHGDYIASGSSDKSIIIWEVKTGNIVRKLLGHSDLVRCVRFDEDFIVSGSYDTNIMVWNLHSGECMFAINGHSNRVFRVQFDKFRIVSSSQDDKIIKFDFSSGVSDMVLKRWSELRPHYRLEPLESNAQTTS